MEKIIELLTNDAVLKVLVSLVIVVWGGFKAKKLMLDDPKNAKKKRVIEIAEGVVKEIFDTEIRELKKAKEDGKLTKEEISAANKKAVEKLKEEGKKKGLEVVKLFAEEYLPVLIDKIVKKLKGK